MPSPYGDRAYRLERIRLATVPTPCWRGCGRRATSPDHHPPLSAHVHVAGSGCCELLPACAPCQNRQGASIRNRSRRPPATTSRRW